jgi:protein involved in polysaccharide export with SLBB domain
MCNRALLSALLLLLVPACASHQPGPAARLAQWSQAGGSGPVGAKFQPASEPVPSPIQLASVSPLAFSQEIPVEDQPQSSSSTQAAAYRLRNGDVVSVKFVKNPELDATVPVRPDGQISLALVGELTAKGVTLAELRSLISRRYTDFIAQTGYGEVLKEGDFFDLRFVYNPELNLGVRIRSDGRISLPLLGEVQATGLRPSELYQQLLKGYAKHLTDPDLALLVGPDTAKKLFVNESFIVVILSKTADQKIFVGGEVLSPKVVAFEGQISVLQALMQAGGVKDTGDLSRVVVLRRGQFEETRWTQTDLSNPLSGKSLENDLVLSSGDVVIVPMTGVAKVDLFVKQYIRDVLPLQSNFNLTIIPIDSSSSSQR